jgi:hypothetical protein
MAKLNLLIATAIAGIVRLDLDGTVAQTFHICHFATGLWQNLDLHCRPDWIVTPV